MFHKKIKTQHLMGFAMESVKKEDKIKVLTEGSLTSNDSEFNIYINQIINLFLSKAGIDYNFVNKFFIVLHKNDIADLYVNDFQEIINVKVNRNISKGEKVYQKDVSSIKEIKFPDIKILEDDVIIYFAKIGWKYCLYFNFTRKINQKEIQNEIAKLIKEFHIPEKKESSYIVDENKKKVSYDKLFTEGITDKKYLEKFKSYFLPSLEFEINDIQDTHKSGGSKKLLNHFNTLFQSNHAGYKCFFIFDCDAKKDYEKCKSIETEWLIPFCWENNKKNNIIKNGIENLFQESLFKYGKNKKKRFFPVIIKDSGNRKPLKFNGDFEKMEFAKFICEERNKKEDYENFKILEVFISDKYLI